MKYPTKIARYGSVLALVCFLNLTPLGAQNTDPTTDEDIFELSPFVVSTSEEMGYLATQSLAGTRIKSNLRDVATTVQTVTEEMLEDLGANSLGDLFSYTTSSEAGGDLGNFTGVSVGGNDVGADAGARAEPQSNLRVRGLGAPDLTRGYFLTNIGFDSYNTQRVEINRGANAILFGLGSPAGVVNNSLITARLGKDMGEVKVRLGEHGSFRGEFDYNVNVIDDRLAIRVAGLYDDTQFKQRPAYELENRFFLTGTLRLDDRTTVRFNSEFGDIEANRPSVIAPTDWISGWILAGKPIHDLSMVGSPNEVAGINSRTRNIDGTAWAGVPEGITMDLGLGTVLNSSDAINQPKINSPGFFAYGTVSIYDNVDAVTSNAGLANMNVANWPRNAAVVNSGELHPFYDQLPWGYQDLRLRDVNGFSDMYGGSSIGVEQQGLNNRDMFDWVNNMIGGSTADQNQDFDTFNIALERLFLEEKNLGVEIVFDKQDYHSDAFSPLQDRFSGITIDSNPYLPYTAEGVLQPNPNYLQPYVFTRYNRRNVRDIERNALRATAFYDLDLGGKFESKWLSWLGRHTLTGLFNKQEVDTDFQRYELHHTDPYFALFGGGPIGTSFNSIVNQRIYVGPAVDPGVTSLSDITIHGLNNTVLWDTDTVNNYVVWDGGIQPGSTKRSNGNNTAGAQEILRVGGEDGYGNLRSIDETNTAYRINATRSNEVIDTQAFNVQSKLFADNLIATFGWRKDEVELTKSNESDFARDTVTNEILFDSVDLNELDPTSVAIETKSWGLVGYLPKQWVTLPFESDLSIHYGESENFRPEAGRINHMGESLQNPGGETTEYGFTVSMFDRKLYARVNWYETALINRSRGYNTGQFINLWSQRPDAYILGYNEAIGDPDPLVAAGADLMLAAAQAIVESIPDAARELYNIRFETDSEGNIIGVQRDNVGVTDTEDLTAKGVEVEVVYNPTPNWRIALNVAKQETTATNVNPHARLFAEQIQATLDTVVPGYGVTIGEMPNWTFDVWDPSRADTLRFREADNDNVYETMAEWNEPAYQGLRTSLAAEGTQVPEQRQWRINLISNYSFKEGPLAGLGIGGAVRYESSSIVDYPLIPNEDGNLVGDIDNPYRAPSTRNYDAWVRYRVPFFKKYVDWDVQLNVRNILADSDDFIPISYHQGGALAGMVSRVRYAPQRTIFITNTFKF